MTTNRRTAPVRSASPRRKTKLTPAVAVIMLFTHRKTNRSQEEFSTKPYLKIRQHTIVSDGKRKPIFLFFHNHQLLTAQCFVIE